MQRIKYCLIVFVLLFSFTASYAQSYTIKGAVSDTLNATRLTNASVTLLRAADSVLETFTRTTQDGLFELHPAKAGKYVIMVTFPSFADYVDVVTLDKSAVVDIGTIPMVSKTHLLNEYVLKQQVATIKIKGDTTEYVADSFAVREGATVEELLKKLPGIQVSKNGEVVAQGEKVQKILVDGEEFFTDDPAVVTKSLQAKAVDKVQVFDRKSDQAQFTGIDDGTREKTINLQLKDDMKKGYFGKLVAGGGTDGFHENQGMFNAFKGKRKISAFGIVANTGKIGLGWQDKDKFGGGNDNGGLDEDGMFVRTWDPNNEDDEFESWSGTYNGQGLPSAWTGGLHYSNKWLDDKLHLSGNYRFARQNKEMVGNTITETNLQDYKQYSFENSNSFSTGDRHRVDGLYEWKIDSTSQLKLTVNAGYSNTKNNTDYDKEARLGDGSLQYDSRRKTTTDATTKSQNASLNWRKKFNKPGRNIALNIDESFKNTLSDGINNTRTDYFNLLNGSVDSVRSVNQLKDNASNSFQVMGKVSYTEPLSKVAFLELNYAATLNNSSASRISLDTNAKDGQYRDTNYLNSSKYDYDYFINTGGANLRFVYKKFNFSIGGAVSNTHFSQRDNLVDSFDYSFDRSYVNFFPRANFVYRVPGKQKSFRINYNGSTQQPTIDQIQPLRQNTDPTNVSIGNPNLRQKFSHNINFNYNDYKIFTNTYTYLGGGVNYIADDISRAEFFDASGNRTYQYLNVDGNYNGWLYGGYGFSVKKLDLRMSVRGNVNVARNNNFINGQKNISANNSYTLGVDFNKDKERKFNIRLSPNVTYNQNTSSINTNNTDYWSFESDLEASFQLPWKMEIGTDVQWYVRQHVAEFDRNNDVFRWNAYVSKKFLKVDQLELRASAFDILNQNIGFQRYGNSNSITQQNYNTIRRYGMLSLIWNFTRSPATTPSEEKRIIIKR